MENEKKELENEKQENNIKASDDRWKKIEQSNFYRFDNIGDSLEGMLIHKQTGTEANNQYGFGEYILQTPKDGQKKFHGSKQLDELMTNINLQDYIKIIFVSTKSLPQGTLKEFEVYLKEMFIEYCFVYIECLVTRTMVVIYLAEPTLKIMVIGSNMVGKTTLIQQYIEKRFQPRYLVTIGVEFKTKILELDGKPIKLLLTDTAGQEKFANLRKTYYAGASACVVVYDITDRNTFEAVDNWLQEFREGCHEVCLSRAVQHSGRMARCNRSQ